MKLGAQEQDLAALRGVIARQSVQLIGLLARTSRGRQLTPGAWEHLGLTPPPRTPEMQPGLFD